MKFHAVEPPTIKELEEVLSEITKKLTRYLEKQKIIVKDDEESFQLAILEEDTFSRLQASSVTYRFATGQVRASLKFSEKNCLGSYPKKKTRKEFISSTFSFFHWQRSDRKK